MFTSSAEFFSNFKEHLFTFYVFHRCFLKSELLRFPHNSYVASMWWLEMLLAQLGLHPSLSVSSWNLGEHFMENMHLEKSVHGFLVSLAFNHIFLWILWDTHMACLLSPNLESQPLLSLQTSVPDLLPLHLEEQDFLGETVVSVRFTDHPGKKTTSWLSKKRCTGAFIWDSSPRSGKEEKGEKKIWGTAREQRQTEGCVGGFCTPSNTEAGTGSV